MFDVLGAEKCRRRIAQEKNTIVRQSFELGMTLFLVAPQHGMAATWLFLWCKQYQEVLTDVVAGKQGGRSPCCRYEAD
ncbi:transposase [Escherichia coli]|nr:transposase [Escherichia coli]ELT2927409.1 transposase [Escherichia coli]